MPTNAYRLKNPITVAVRQEDHYRLVQLPTGSVFYPSVSKPDSNGMIDGTCRGDALLMFSSDLEDRAEPAAAEIYASHPTRNAARRVRNFTRAKTPDLRRVY